MIRSFVFSLAVLASIAWACVPTTTVTTTTVCCQPLTISSMPKIAPVAPIANYQQCSVLRRLSSNCPTLGYLVCTAAPDTNPTSVAVQAVGAGNVQIAQATGSTQATLRLFCVNGVWKATNSATATTVTQVSCSQTGSSGRDFDNQDATGK